MGEELLMSKIINNERLTGERAAYGVKDVQLNNCVFEDGESPLKHSVNIECNQTAFKWKYPVWHSSNVKINNSAIFEGGRAGIWYTDHIDVTDTVIEAPKEFRRCNHVTLKNVTFTNAEETFWSCNEVNFDHVTAKGNYFAMNSSNMKMDNFTLVGNYPFDGCKNIEIHNSRLLSKDAFWNCENVTVYDSYVCGEYFGWNSKNITLVNCTIESNQGFCYINNLTMKDCTLINTDLAFEYTTNIDANLKGKIISVKNPGSGKIVAQEIGELILDETKIDIKSTEIVCDKIGKTTLGISDSSSI